MSRAEINKTNFVIFTNQQLCLLEEILNKEIKFYVSDLTFQRFIKSNNPETIRNYSKNDIDRYQSIGKLRLKVVKALNNN